MRDLSSETRRQLMAGMAAVALTPPMAWAQPQPQRAAPAGSKSAGKKDGERASGLNLATPEKYARLDKRQLAFSSPRSGGGLPQGVDLSGDLPPPGNQGEHSACTAWAVAYGLRSYLARQAQRNWDFRAGGGVNHGRVFSPAYVYGKTRTSDGGATLVDVLAFMRDSGVVTWADYPYDTASPIRVPGPGLQRNAARWRIANFETVAARSFDIKLQLANRRPVLIGAEISREFKDGRLGSDMVWRQPGDPIEAHAMLLVGYDDRRRAFRLMNSWGSEWGDGGYAWLSYDLVPQVVREAYVATDIDAATAAVLATGTAEDRPTRRTTPILVGFQIRAGDVLDGIAPIFREMVYENSRLSLGSRAWVGRHIGGQGGGLSTLEQPGAHVVGLRIKQGNYFGARHVLSLQVDLRNMTTGAVTTSPWYGSGAHATDVTAPIEYRTRNGHMISGLGGSVADHTSGETFVSSVEVVETRLDWYR